MSYMLFLSFHQVQCKMHTLDTGSADPRLLGALRKTVSGAGGGGGMDENG